MPITRLEAAGTYLNTSNDVFTAGSITATTNSNIVVTDGKDLVTHLHVTAASGTTPSMTVKFQDSGDGTNWVDIPSGAFTAATAAGSQRLVLNNVGNLVRAVATITGTTPSFTFRVTAQSWSK